MLIEIYQCDYPGCECKSDKPFEEWSASYEFDGMICNFHLMVQAHLTVCPDEPTMLCPDHQEFLLTNYLAQKHEKRTGEDEIYGECDCNKTKSPYGNPMEQTDV